MQDSNKKNIIRISLIILVSVILLVCVIILISVNQKEHTETNQTSSQSKQKVEQDIEEMKKLQQQLEKDMHSNEPGSEEAVLRDKEAIHKLRSEQNSENL